jgi:hypothetical protein
MGRITEDNISEAMREIRTALLEADVNYEVVKEFIRNVKEKALGLEVEKSLKPEELFIKLVKDELVTLLGGDYVELITLGEKGLSSERTTFERYTPFKITTEWLGNSGTTNFTGTFLWALTDKDGKIKENLATLNVSNLPSRHGWHNLERNCTITVPLAIGDRIRVFYKSTQTLKWTLIEGGEECVWELLVTDEYSIEETTRIRFQKNERTFIVNTKDGVNIKFTNDRGTSLNHLCETKENETIIHTNGLPAGNYLLNLKKTFENKDVRIKLGESTQQQ